jgi:hypothetical protein
MTPTPPPPAGPICETAYDDSLDQIIPAEVRAEFDAEIGASIDWAVCHPGASREIDRVPGTDDVFCLKVDGTPRFPMLRVYFVPGPPPRLLDVDEVDFYGDEEDATS